MSAKNITFSIIMPCYNSEAYVRNALDSIVGQTYPHWELVAVNDGSFDSTLDILSEYAKDEPRIKIYSKENGGYCSAVNMGLDHVTGDYFLMLGSDDRLATDLFEKLTDSIDSELPDVLTFRAMKIKDGQEIGVDTFTDFDTPCTEFNTTLSEFTNTHPEHAKILFCRDTAKCFKREKLGDLRYFGKSGIVADNAFSALFCHSCNSFLSVPINGYFWTMRDNSISAAVYTLETERERMLVWGLFFQKLQTISEKLLPREWHNWLGFVELTYNVILETKFLMLNYFFIKNTTKIIGECLTHFSQAKRPRKFMLIRHFPLTYSVLSNLKTFFRKFLSKLIHK